MKKLDVPQSGSQGSTTASRNRFGQYNRQRAMPTQPRSSLQVAVRANFSRVSATWRSITAAQRSAWAAFAAAKPFNDSLGQTIFLTGHQYFVKVNTILLNAGEVVVNDAPNLADVIEQVDASFVAPSATAVVLLLQETVDAVLVSVSVSPPQSAGVSFCDNFRFIVSASTTNGDTSSFNLTAAMGAKYGALASGQKFFVKLTSYNAAGALGAELRLDFTLE